MSLHFELVTPERIVLTEEVDQLSLPTTEGEITILNHHAALIAALVPGVVRLKKGSDEEELAVSGGFIEVSADGHVRVLADTAERGSELNLATIEAAKVRAEQAVVAADETSFAQAAAGLERELARYRVARKHSTRRIPGLDSSNLPSGQNPV